VDDQVENRKLLSFLLRREGYGLIEAVSPGSRPDHDRYDVAARYTMHKIIAYFARENILPK